MHDRGLAAGVGALDGRGHIVVLLDKFAVASEALGDLVEPHVVAPVHAGLRRRLAEGALVDAYLEPPLVVDADHAHQRQVLPRGGFQFGDVEQERRSRWSAA